MIYEQLFAKIVPPLARHPDAHAGGGTFVGCQTAILTPSPIISCGVRIGRVALIAVTRIKRRPPMVFVSRRQPAIFDENGKYRRTACCQSARVDFVSPHRRRPSQTAIAIFDSYRDTTMEKNLPRLRFYSMGRSLFLFFSFYVSTGSQFLLPNENHTIITISSRSRSFPSLRNFDEPRSTNRFRTSYCKIHRFLDKANGGLAKSFSHSRINNKLLTLESNFCPAPALRKEKSLVFVLSNRVGFLF